MGVFNIKFTDFIRSNKLVVFITIVLILLLGALIGKNLLFKDPDVVVKFGDYGKGPNTETVKKTNKSSKLGKKLPYAEEIISKYAKASEGDSENTISDFILEEYGADIYSLYTAGLIPSTSLTEPDNLLIVLSGNTILDSKNNYYGVGEFKQTFDFIDSDGENPLYSKSNPTREDWEYSLPEVSKFNNVTSTIESKKIFMQGGFIRDYTQFKDYEMNMLMKKYNTTGVTVESDGELENLIKETIGNKHLLNIPIIIKEDMKISEIKKEMGKVQINDKNVSFLDVDMSDESTQELVGLMQLEREFGEDYVVAGYSSLNMLLLIDENMTMYESINYLTYNKKQVELTDNNSENTLTTLVVWDNFNTGED